jgi:hypothetical protein
MSNPKGNRLKSKKCQTSYVFEAFNEFIDRHLVEGHDVRMFLDPNGNSYAIFCAACDPRMGEVMEPRQ